MSSPDAAEQDSKTEEPTPRRLEQARREGQVAVGKDAVSLAAVAGCALAAYAATGPLGQALQEAVRIAAGGLHAPSAEALSAALRPVAVLGIALVGAAALFGVAGAVAQTRGGVWGKPLAPDLSRLWQGGKLKRLFNGEAGVDLLLSAVKVVALGAVTVAALEDTFLTLSPLLRAQPGAQATQLVETLFATLARLCGVLAVAAGVDLAVTRRRLRKKLMMTRDEVRREVKEDEGDPLLKGRRRRRHRELARAHMVAEVPKADALLVNPTHVAVALRYRRDEGGAPRVIARGKGAVAEKMREVARASGVPIVENIPLARLLYRRVKVGGQVPAETFKAVAAVLAFVYRLTGRASGEARP